MRRRKRRRRVLIMQIKMVIADVCLMRMMMKDWVRELLKKRNVRRRCWL